ncbi:unnamed protein product, partial [Urochloa humidicola]
ARARRHRPLPLSFVSAAPLPSLLLPQTNPIRNQLPPSLRRGEERQAAPRSLVAPPRPVRLSLPRRPLPGAPLEAETGRQYTAPDAGMQSQIVCHACRTVLLYPRGAPSVCCAVCQAVTTVPPPGLEMAQLICGGCRTLLMYTRSADTVRCSCCNTVNLVRPVNNIAHVNCGHCQTTLMYPYGAHSVKCAICNHITITGVNTVAPTPSSRPVSNGSSTSAPKSQPQNVTVVVENPMTVDDKGKLVSNVVVGVTTGKN